MLLCTHYIYNIVHIIYNMIGHNLCDKEIIIHVKSNKILLDDSFNMNEFTRNC